MSLRRYRTLCHSVAEAHWFMEQFAFFEQRSLEMLAAWVWTTGDLEAKQEFGTQAHEDAVHADLFLQRVKELHPSMPTYGWQPRPQVTAPYFHLLREIASADMLERKLCGMYGVIKPWLLQQYQTYLQQADPILEGPTVVLLKRIIQEEESQIAWGQSWLDQQLAAQPELRQEIQQWQGDISTRLGELTETARSATIDDLAPEEPLIALEHEQPVSDPQMHLVYYSPTTPPPDITYDPQSEREIQHIMMTNQICNEMEAAELLCRILVEFPTLPWQMRLELSRQMWDECRHSASQWRILESLDGSLGMYPAIAYINEMVAGEPDVLKRLIVLQRVVEGVGLDLHRPRAQVFREKGVDAIVQMLDYILADEDIHIAFSHWIPQLADDDQARQQELLSYQAQKEQETAAFLDWVISKRRDLARVYKPTPKTSAQG